MENKELGRLILKQADAFPETFDMFEWIIFHPCHTSACICGHAMLLSGYTFGEVPGIEGVRWYRPDGSLVADEEEEGIALLGLTEDDYQGPGERLFYDNDENAIARLTRLVRE